MKPARYYVEYGDEAAWAKELARCGGVEEATDPAHFVRQRDFGSLAAARRYAATCSRVVPPAIYERTRLRDVTPDGDPAGLLWEWDASEVLL